MSIVGSRLFLVVGVILASAKAEENGYPRENPSSRFVGSGESPLRKFTDDEMTGGEIPGEPGKDYPIFRDVPETSFGCDQQQFPGYYADVEARCQAFHICLGSGRKDSLLCPNGTVFNQENLVCDWWYNFDCSKAPSFYSVNEAVVRAMEEADRRSADRKTVEGYRYDPETAAIGKSTFYQQERPSSFPIVTPQSDFDTVVVEAVRTPPRSQSPLRANVGVYPIPETTAPPSKERIENLDSGFINEATKITGVDFGPRSRASAIPREYLPAKY